MSGKTIRNKVVQDIKGIPILNKKNKIKKIKEDKTMEDTIKIKVNENGQWVEYSLPYEEFEYIQPILERCKEKRVVNFDPNDPEQSAEMLSRIFMPFGPAQQNGRVGVIYNLEELPKEMTKEEVEDIYQRKNILYIRSKMTPTQQIN